MYNGIKKKFFCTRCGKAGHEQKFCSDPVTSWGIILVSSIHEKCSHFNTNLNNYKNCEGIKVFNKDEILLAAENINKLKFLLVMRKHSLGFSEFIRGKYVVGNINGLRGLFNQMIQEEIDMIKEKNFDELWNYFWGTNEINITLNRKEYNDSKNKFMDLKTKFSGLIEHDLDFYLNNAIPNHPTPEWGFPKGRKKRGESDLECAIREFCEETDISENDIHILNNIKPIEEELYGTNGVKYKHIYFLAELKNNKKYYFDNNINISNSEIGNIGFFTYDEALFLLRDYHIEKKNILKCILNYYVDIYKKKVNYEKEEWHCEMD